MVFSSRLLTRPIIVAILVGIVALAIRLPGIGSFMTADEEGWMLRSAEFYHKVFRNNDPGGTYLTSHPGVVTMWLSGGGIFLQEQRLGADITPANIFHFRRAATLPIALATAMLIGVATFVLMTVLGSQVGGLAGVLLAVDPYLTGMSQVVHVDPILALSMLNALLAFFRYRKLYTARPVLPPFDYEARAIAYKIVSGIFVGVALANKLLPALWIVGMLAIIIAFWKVRWQHKIRTFFFIIGVGILTFYVLWPALWVKPGLTGNFQDAARVAATAHVDLGTSLEAIAPYSFYARTFLGRTTPFVLILTVAALLVSAVARVRQKKMTVVLWLLVYAVSYLIFISLAAKKADRYALPALVVFPVVAGWALSVGLQVLSQRVALFTQPSVKIFTLAAICVLAVIQTAIWIPYTIAYNNPWFDVRSKSQQGWGEGLEQAAAWLNRQPKAQQLRVASWYPTVLQTYFRGKAGGLSLREDKKTAFVVLYRNMYGRGAGETATDVLREYRDKTPAHIIDIQGVFYVWIYEARAK
jgi:hypothetical protein